MISKQSFSLKFICFFCAVCVGFLSAMPVFAQETERTLETKVVKVKKPARAATIKVAIDPVAALTAEIQQCGTACSMGGPDSISSGGGTVLEYDCDENGNCSCFGAADCVAMAPICAEGTLGCNDQGCICEEG